MPAESPLCTQWAKSSHYIQLGMVRKINITNKLVENQTASWREKGMIKLLNDKQVLVV